MNHAKQTPDKTRSLCTAMQQLSNHTNLRIIQLLYNEGITMNFVLRRRLGITTQLASKRLKALSAVGLVTSEHIFKRKVYRLNRERFAAIGVSLEMLLKDLSC
ncbi:MAG: ArsR family transcriptional regulator [Chitinophagaceae bacterium]|nr:MAG: ArsR family transcriptional regulator [Chitinophagaceae bacterium]